MTDPLTRLLRLCALPGALLLAACGSDSDPAPPTQPTRALVALYGTGELVALSLEDGSIVDTLAPAYRPNDVAVRGDLARAVSLSGDDGMVEEIDLSGATLAASGNETDALYDWYPFTASYGGNAVAVASWGYEAFGLWTPPAAGQLIALENGSSMWDVASNADGTRFFFADYGGKGAVFVTDGAGALLDEFFLDDLPVEAASSSSPVALAVSPDGGRLYVANYRTDFTEAADDLMVFDVAPDGMLAFVKRVFLKDADDDAIAADLYDSHGMTVSPDGSEVWIAYDRSAAGGGGVAVYQTATDRVDLVPFGGDAYPCEIALDWAGGKAYLPGTDYSSGDGTDEIVVVDVATLAVTSIPLPADSDPTGIALY